MVNAYDIDPSWPEVRHAEGDQIVDSEMEDCEGCFCRAAVTLGERGGVEVWLCGMCR